jgi:hypothetical protein
MKAPVTILIGLLIASLGSAATVTKKKSTLSTDVNFEDQLVNGKYAYPDEAIATVEDDKLLNDLLAVRKNFKDRLEKASVRN